MTASLAPWRGFTIIRGIAFSTDPSDRRCTLLLSLADDVGGQARVVQMEFRGVANLTMRNLGGGISQFCGLMSEDISSRQWDRLHYRVFDVEHDAIEFLCDSFDCYDERRSN
ncbi:MAG: hypothetical protein ABL997_07510 [Planctomycetota bacterium]